MRMEKNIWVLNENKVELSEIQQKLNATGALRTFCMLSGYAMKLMIDKCDDEDETYNRPSLIIYDYQTSEEEDFKTLNMVQNLSRYAGVPVAFLVEKKTDEVEDICYERGATLVLVKPLNRKMIKRIEQISWQYEMTRNYQKILQEQVYEIKAAREIKELNTKLESRNELLRMAFGRYFSNEVVEEILEKPDGANIGGVKKVVTVMMADIRGFTAISENYDAGTITDMINNFLGKMTDIIFEHKGSVIEFIGDAILAVFGAPVETDNPEFDAVSAAIDMQNAMKSVNEFNRNMGYPRIEVGIGLHKGELFIGNIGSEKMMRYNIIGGTVNMCSRIESCSIGGQILASDELVKNIKDKIEIANSTEIIVKGISTKIVVHDICGLSNGEDRHKLNKRSDEEFISLRTEVEVSLYAIRNGEIDLKPYPAVITAMSGKCASVEMKTDEKPELYTDVEIIANDKQDAEKIKNSYGKVMWEDGNQIMLKFTYGNLLENEV